MNVTSMTFPYRHRYRNLPIDYNIEYSRIEIEDFIEEDDDKPGEIVEKTRIVRDIFKSLVISEYAKNVFMWRFFCGEKFSEWPRTETEKELFNCYYKVVNLIKEKLNGETLF